MKITKVEEVQISKNALVTVTEMNHILEIQHMEKKNKTCHIQKLDSDRYVDKRTGEIKEFERSENRSQNMNSLRQTFKKMRYLINNNFFGARNELFLTLTYKGELQTRDHLKVGKDYDNFLKRLKRKYGSVDAIRILEPHESGCWHMHVLMRFNDVDAIYIPNETLREIWGNGWVTVQGLNNVDNIGAYVSAYVTDIEVPEERAKNLEGHTDLVEKEVDGQKKKFLKGARLAFYQSGVNLYTKTKGIVYPERKEMTYEQAIKKVGAATPHFKKSIAINDEEKDFSNTITYEQYNLKR